MCEVSHALHVQVAEVSADARFGIKVALAGADLDAARVTLVLSLTLPTASEASLASALVDGAGVGAYPPLIASRDGGGGESQYVSGRALGEEVRYVLERRQAMEQVRQLHVMRLIWVHR